jgi:hypothetical protein
MTFWSNYRLEAEVLPQISQHGPDTRQFTVGDRVIAIVHLDHLGQTQKVVLYEGSSSEAERVFVLGVTASHAKQFVMHRTQPAFGGSMVRETRNPELSRADSDRFFEPELVPEEIQTMTGEDLTEALRAVGVQVVLAPHASLQSALPEVVADPRIEPEVSFEVLGEGSPGYMRVRFSVESPAQFRFWCSMSRPGEGLDLDIIPHYHPVMNGKRYAYLVNGDTNALIRGDAVRYIHSPEEARVRSGYWSTWSAMKHPVRAEGQTFEAEVSIAHALSREGVELIVGLLVAALELEDSYVAISGGFRAPFDYPANVARRFGIHPERGQARGSENHCAWMYHTLVAEGELDGSYVPAWFIEEGWLRAYPSLDIVNALR